MSQLLQAFHQLFQIFFPFVVRIHEHLIFKQQVLQQLFLLLQTIHQHPPLILQNIHKSTHTRAHLRIHSRTPIWTEHDTLETYPF